MAMLYVFPSSIYSSGYIPDNLDEINIDEPQGANLIKPVSTASQARFTLSVNSFVLHDVVVTITLTRLQSGLANPSAVSSNGATWTYTNNDATTPAFEAKWSRPQINKDTTTEFSVDFNVGATVGWYFATFRVTAKELSLAAQCEIQHQVVP